MNARFILRESHDGRIVPRSDFGLYASRKQAKTAAKSMGLPSNLIHRVRRPS